MPSVGFAKGRIRLEVPLHCALAPANGCDVTALPPRELLPDEPHWGAHVDGVVSVPGTGLALLILPSLAWIVASTTVSYWLTACLVAAALPIGWALAELNALSSDDRPPRASVNVWALTIFVTSMVVVVPGTAIALWFLREIRPLSRVGPWRKRSRPEDSSPVDHYASKGS